MTHRTNAIARFFVAAGVALTVGGVALTACGAMSHDASPATTASTQITALDMTWASAQGAAAICPPYNQVRTDPGTDDEVVAGIQKQMSETLTPEARQHLLDLLHAC